MWAIWILLVTTIVMTKAGTAEDYYKMPKLYEMDDFEECFTNPRGAFCLGTFQLHSQGNDALMDIIQQFSSDKCNFNHSLIRRGYCVSTRCQPEDVPLPQQFQRCVSNLTQRHGLTASLTQLDYCRTADQKTWRPVDGLDIAYAVLVAVIVILNVLGTVYDFRRKDDCEPNSYLLAWSLKANWARLTANYVDGDPRLTALRPAHGVKAITLMMVVLAHSVMMFHMTFVTNPVAFERACRHPLMIYVQNGTVIVQTFIMSSSFFLAYNLLLRTDPKNQLTLRMFPKCLIHRVTRILPAYILVLGATVTWWSLLADGPLWEVLVGSECTKCRDKWWTHLLFVNQLVKPDVKCLTHTWFLAVDMQLYIVSAVLTLTLGGDPRRGLQVLAGIFLAAVLGNFLLAYFLQLGSMLTIMVPKSMFVLFSGERSFLWLYQTPWSNLPCCIIGLFIAFLHYHLQTTERSLKEYKWFCVLYRLSVPALFVWTFLGYFLKDVSSPLGEAVFAAVDRPVMTTIIAAAMLGFFNQLDESRFPGVWWRFLSWRGWAVLDRMSLSVYLLHWLLAFMQLGARPGASPATLDDVGGHFVFTMLLTYLTALPLHLGLELPMQKLFRTVFK